MKINIVQSEDWEGLYIDDKLIIENHRLSLREVFMAIGMAEILVRPDDKWIYEQGSFPSDYKDVVLEKP